MVFRLLQTVAKIMEIRHYKMPKFRKYERDLHHFELFQVQNGALFVSNSVIEVCSITNCLCDSRSLPIDYEHELVDKISGGVSFGGVLTGKCSLGRIYSRSRFLERIRSEGCSINQNKVTKTDIIGYMSRTNEEIYGTVTTLYSRYLNTADN